MCEALITLVKVLSNTKRLKLVLISSEGAVMPFLQELSATNRAYIFEIGDVSDSSFCGIMV